MADVRCPMCGKPNPEELEECQFCGARLKPIIASPSVDSQTIKPGEEPVKRNTSELEKINLSRGAPIRPGEAPTRKNTADLERALPSWLRSLREGNKLAAGESMAEPSVQETPPAPSQPAPASDASAGSPDWLSGLSQAASEEEQVPDWLAGLRGGKGVESAPAPASQEELSPELSNADWMARLGDQPQEPTPAASAEKTPAWEQPGAEPPPEPVAGEFTPDWLKGLQSSSPAGQPPPRSEPPPEPAGMDNSPDWLNTLQSTPSDAQAAPAALQGADNLPEWLSGLPGLSAQSRPSPSEALEPAQADSLPDWLGQPDQKSAPPEPGAPAAADGSVPDWLSSFSAAAALPAAAPAENVPDWLSNLEEKSKPASAEPAPEASRAPDSAALPPAETPGWLSQLQSDVSAAQEAQQHKDDFEVVPAPPASQTETGPLPDWLSGIEPAAPSSTSSTPALIGDNKDIPQGEQAQSAFSMETPDWLAQLNPEQAADKSATANEGQAETENLEAAELPSWVQAMRPVESVVESKTALVDENRIAEISGPLAGLRGVLPSEPGLGLLRKPPAYSTKLQVSEGQQRYAATLEQLIVGESTPRVTKTTRLHSNQLLRWLIAALLFLAVGLPLIGANTNGAQIAPPTSLESADAGASSKIIGALSGNVPVLVAFDYDPALSGELEAVAAPLMDQLLTKNVPLAFISTSPTGPALAEHFLLKTPLVNMHQYQSGMQYVNLGYLAGGPAGILYFANAPTEAMQFTQAGQPVVWGTGPLQGIQKLSDFAAVIILTDNADTGRNWIEQAGTHLGSTPMLMVISAQAEPMIRPYFDSGQVKGLISGLTDAKIYEQTYTRPGLANRYWDSFSIGMLVAELLIGAGAVLGVVIDWRARQKVSGEEA